eukprot:2694317-Prymnesium_polylepis.1
MSCRVNTPTTPRCHQTSLRRVAHRATKRGPMPIRGDPNRLDQPGCRKLHVRADSPLRAPRCPHRSQAAPSGDRPNASGSSLRATVALVPRLKLATASDTRSAKHAG